MSSVQKQIIKNILSDYNLFFNLKGAYRDKQVFYRNLLQRSRPSYPVSLITKTGEIIPLGSSNK